MENKEQELWKDVKGFEKHLRISNYGRIERKINGNITFGTNDNKGYKTLKLSIDHKNYSFRIHRLVYSHFIGKLDNELVIDHIDNIPYNNYYKNLQQITNRENCSKNAKSKYSDYTGVSFNPNCKRWYARIKLKGVLYNLGYCNTPEQARDIYLKVLKNPNRKYEFKNLYEPETRITSMSKIVEQYTLDNKLVTTYPTIALASRKNNISKHYIAKWCKNEESNGNYIWKYKD